MSKRSPLAVGELAEALGICHTAVAKIADEMLRAGLIRAASDGRRDRRQRLYAITADGKRTQKRLEPVWREIGRAVSELLVEADGDLLAGIGRFERAFARRSVVDRVRERLRLEPRRRLEIVDYRPAYKKHFRSLNEQWIREHFEIEKEDVSVLSDPMGRDRPPGRIRALRALGRRGRRDLRAHEASRGPSSSSARWRCGPTSGDRGIGAALITAAIGRARSMGARELYLRTDLVLRDAIRLYRRAGFRRVARDPLEYCRMCRECITMRIDLVRSKRNTP